MLQSIDSVTRTMSALGNEDNEEDQKCQHDKEYLHDQPSVTGYAIQILEELGLRRINIGEGLLHILVNTHR